MPKNETHINSNGASFGQWNRRDIDPKKVKDPQLYRQYEKTGGFLIQAAREVGVDPQKVNFNFGFRELVQRRCCIIN
ncbi:hypothetical protein [Acinetobacter baumannii]|uniref:hypothetical protein n=1 Tax=Acinetobacter baumannii TaxID=470 RepID=UPI001D18B4B1|nr:hypothetical protein [Acinetobacter baumannii]